MDDGVNEDTDSDDGKSGVADPFTDLEEAAFIAKGYCELASDTLQVLKEAFQGLSRMLTTIDVLSETLVEPASESIEPETD